MACRMTQILLERWKQFRFLFCMCFVEAFTSLSVSLLKFSVFPFHSKNKLKKIYLTMAGEQKLKSLY